MRTNEVSTWFRQNLWAMIIVLASFIFGYATLNARVDAMEKKLAQYPSYDYFELKFTTIDAQLTALKLLLTGYPLGK